MSLTISPSAGDDNVCKTTKLASLSSGLVVPGVNLSTSSVSSSGHRVMPGLYSDSQVGQNILGSVAQDAIWRDPRSQVNNLRYAVTAFSNGISSKWVKRLKSRKR